MGVCLAAELYEIFLSRAKEKWRSYSETSSVNDSESGTTPLLSLTLTATVSATENYFCVFLPLDGGASLADRESSLDLIKLDISRTFPSLFIFQKVNTEDHSGLQHCSSKCSSLISATMRKEFGRIFRHLFLDLWRLCGCFCPEVLQSACNKQPAGQSHLCLTWMSAVSSSCRAVRTTTSSTACWVPTRVTGLTLAMWVKALWQLLPNI